MASNATGNAAPAAFVKGTRVVFARELSSMFDSAIAYVCLSAFTALAAAVYMNDFFTRAVLDMTPYFRLLPLLCAVFAPALTMRLWAEEKRSGTFELLMTLPLTAAQCALGKFLSALVFYIISLAGSLPIVWMLNRLGAPDNGLIVSGYIGAALLGAVFIAAGAFASSLTDSQIVSFVIAAFINFVFVFTGNDAVAAAMDGLAPSLQIGALLYENVSVVPHFESFVRGLTGAGDMFYFAALAAAFLWACAAVVDRSRP